MTGNERKWLKLSTQSDAFCIAVHNFGGYLDLLHWRTQYNVA